MDDLCNKQMCPVAGGGFLYCNASNGHEGDCSHTFPQVWPLEPRMSVAEAELKYAAEKALCWMQGALLMPVLQPWIDPVTVQMLEVAIGHSTVEPVIPKPDKLL